MYIAYMRRKSVEQLDARKIAITSALYANSAFYKSENGPQIRNDMIKDIEEKFAEIKVEVYDSRTRAEIEAAEQADPFIAAINLEQQIVETQEQRNERLKEREA